MNQEEYRIFDDNNNEFIVSNKNGTFECKKIIEGDKLVDPTKEELEFVIKELERQANQTQSLSTEDIINTIKQLIEEKKINNYEELYNYINGLNLSVQEKNKIFEQTNTLLVNDTKEKSEIIKLKEELIDIIRKNSDRNIAKIITFDVKANISGAPICNINLTTVDNGLSKIQKDISKDYNEELKKDLIEPVLQELVLTSRAAQNVEPSDASFGYRSNFHLQTEENCFAHLNNIEQDYAYRLQEDIISLNNSPKISDSSARDAKISEIQNEKDLENQRSKEAELKRIKKKKMEDKKGFSSNLLLYLLTTIITAFTLITQIIMFK